MEHNGRSERVRSVRQSAAPLLHEEGGRRSAMTFRGGARSSSQHKMEHLPNGPAATRVRGLTKMSKKLLPSVVGDKHFVDFKIRVMHKSHILSQQNVWPPPLLSPCTGCRAGNGEKQSSSQAEPG